MLLFRSCGSRALWLWSRIVKCDFKTNFTGVLALAGKALPNVALTTASNDDTLQINPCLSNQICSLIIRKDGNFKLVVVGRIVNRKA